MAFSQTDRKSTRLNSSHTEIYTLSLHDALPILVRRREHTGSDAEEKLLAGASVMSSAPSSIYGVFSDRSEEHTSELQSHRDLHSFPTRRSSDLSTAQGTYGQRCRREVAGRGERHEQRALQHLWRFLR